MGLALLRRQTCRHSLKRGRDDGSRFKLCLSLPLAPRRYMPSDKPDQQQTRTRILPLLIVFEVPAEAKAIRQKVAARVHNKGISVQNALDTKPLEEVLGK